MQPGFGVWASGFLHRNALNSVGHYGIVGAACLWFGINLGFVAIGVPLMHRRFMRGEMARWYLQDMLPPFVSAAVAGVFLRWLIPALSRSPQGILELALICGITLSAAAVTSPAVRSLARQVLLATS